MVGKVYDAQVFGAIGDGLQKDTEAIQRAIDQCYKDGGGIVSLSNGIFLCGTLYLRSHVYLSINAGAILLASSDINDYGTDTHFNRYRNEKDIDRCFIYAEDEENFGILGFGQINGNSEAFPNKGSIDRPMMIRFLRCSNITIKNVKLYNAAAWTTAFLDSRFIWIDSVDIRNEKRYNGDGLDFDGCCHVFVSNCHIKGTDDNLCLQASSKEYPVHDIHINNCSFSSICAAIRIGLKSIGSISGVVIANCTMNRVWREGIKIECSEGGNISDILVQNVMMKDVSRPIFILLNNRFEPDGLGSSINLMEMPEIGTMERLIFNNITAVDTKEMRHTHLRSLEQFEKQGKEGLITPKKNDIMGRPSFSGIRFDAEKNHPIKDVTLSNIFYRFIGGVSKSEIPTSYPVVNDRRQNNEEICSENYYPDWSRVAFMDARNIRNLSLQSVCFELINPDEREPYLIENCQVVKEEISIRR